jgi:hypothetical protein
VDDRFPKVLLVLQSEVPSSSRKENKKRSATKNGQVRTIRIPPAIMSAALWQLRPYAVIAEEATMGVDSRKISKNPKRLPRLSGALRLSHSQAPERYLVPHEHLNVGNPMGLPPWPEPR